MPLTQALDENIQQARMGVMTLICTLYFFSLALYPFNSLFSAQMKEVKPLTCLPVPLSAASNVSGKFQRGQTKIKHKAPGPRGGWDCSASSLSNQGCLSNQPSNEVISGEFANQSQVTAL